MLSELKKGDQVVTSSGIIGRILEISNDQITLESGDSKLRISRAAVGGLVQQDGGDNSGGK